ncbi:MAG: hypothetical protein N4A64_11085, partial [Marinisporobacter sp.]|nr:hypothetical protein [Marinisporobacter sp.]
MKEDKKHLDKIWEEVLKVLENELISVSFATWIEPIQIVEFNNKILVLAIDNNFSKDIVEPRYTDRIKTIIKQLTGDDIEIEYVVNWKNVDSTKSIAKDVDPEETTDINDILKSVEDIRNVVEEVKLKEVNIEERVKKQLMKIAQYIDNAANSGRTDTVVILDHELHNKDE